MTDIQNYKTNETRHFGQEDTSSNTKEEVIKNILDYNQKNQGKKKGMKPLLAAIDNTCL